MKSSNLAGLRIAVVMCRPLTKIAIGVSSAASRVVCPAEPSSIGIQGIFLNMILTLQNLHAARE